MELISPASFLLTLYLNKSNPVQTLMALPSTHKILTSLYLVHYCNRALISPLRAPAYAPAHVIVLIVATYFNYLNGYSLGGWFLLQHGKVDESGPFWKARFAFGVITWVIGFIGNIWHEDVLYEIRRRAKREHLEEANRKKDDSIGQGVELVDAGKGRLVVRAENSGHIYEGR